ncbi:hypothetical protein M3147_10965 [Agromyces mediolanus]|uniref:hypothetical protein n=1 Tax=Agromyces mediolanus TaxID=41986 RepID=UPI00203F7E50|nr:hypothetical protein [Agromyces mediolanus]MCM3657772.1 hypothetical protein [Agromyces mediolanus]
MITLTDHVTLWLEQDCPVRLYWREQRWRVTDTPTPIYADADADNVPPMITHPGRVRVGWTITMCSAGGEALRAAVVRDFDESRLVPLP